MYANALTHTLTQRMDTKNTQPSTNKTDTGQAACRLTNSKHNKLTFITVSMRAFAVNETKQASRK